MNEFLKALNTFGMEGMNSEVEEVEAYANSECAEELIELDNLDAMDASMESMSEAIMDGALSAQTMALEAAGFSLDTASGFAGELSTEAIANMAKRGYYEVKIQAKKLVQKIWKLIMSIVESLMGAEGRLKSYGKLFKKYKERLQKVYPKDNKDGDEKEVTIRDWEAANITGKVDLLVFFAGGRENNAFKKLTSLVKATDFKAGVTSLCNFVTDFIKDIPDVLSKSDNKATLENDKNSVVAELNKIKNPSDVTKEIAEEVEKAVEKLLADVDTKAIISDLTEAFSDVDSDEYKVTTAKQKLLSIATKLEESCKKDLKFKKNLIALRKAWDKKTGEWELKADDANRDAAAAILRTLNKFTPVITGYRMFVSKYYKLTVSQLQGVLADMAKVIAKGTNVTA